MAKKKMAAEGTGDGVLDLRHTGVTRLNIPPAGLTARGEIARERKLKYDRGREKRVEVNG